MKDVALKGTGDDDEGKKFFVEFHQQWSALLSPKGYNWIDFTIVHWTLEKESMTGRYTMDLALLGLVLRFTYVYDDTWNKEMKQRMADIKSGKEKTVPFDIADFVE